MNQLLFERSTGRIGPNVFARLETTRFLNSFCDAPQFRFDGGERLRGSAVQVDEAGSSVTSDAKTSIWAHQAGVNALAIERFDGRLLISGGSDASVKLWDLEQCGNPSTSHIFKAISQVPRSEKGHKFGITTLSFYPFDSAAFLSTSYDQTLKLWSTDTLSVSGSFPLGSKVYTHTVSPIASHLLVACGTQHPAVRLVDLRSGSNIQSLAGHTAAILAAAWSPRHEHIVATGSVDGTVRIWDVRRAGGAIGMLDQEDSLGLYRNGLLGSDGKVRTRMSAKAHSGPVNGLTWTDDGAYIVSAGQDRRIRVWDAATGANTLANFGPSIKNSHLASVTMFTSPLGLTHPGKEVLFWPNETELLVMDLHDGHTITKLRGTGPAMAGVKSAIGAGSAVKNRVTSIAWRGAGGGGSSSGVVMGGTNMAGALYSAHMDGQIRAWTPQLEGLDEEGEDDGNTEVSEDKAKKRKAMNDVFQNLMGKKITFI
ncbi:WD40-repeat-containing domain protein [Pseudomassariella vexata]|uniref:WD40-repeat-containing domain protein n=1 Tax=Pseudomassariella vexata TaxID=1141098 RepID=A0A1Y2EBL7_9PEZI|nr:WD40-repeat-containing domain protein [Pseudomassariella vexata]ORY68666.1 WD40-repeat-containing domain protein [Pseudomassariella vexata]